MKNATINTMVKILFFTAVIALFTFGTVLSANAQDGNNPVSVKYIGAVGNKPLFLVEFDNLAEEDVLVSLKDAEGNVLYTERFQGKKYSKRFQLDRTEDDVQITLSLMNRNNRQTQQFQINRNTRVVEDVTVTKVR